MVLNPEKVEIDIPGIPVKEPAFGLPGMWIKRGDSERAQMWGLTIVDASTVVATHLTEAIKANAHDLLGRQELQSILDAVSRTHPKVVEELIPQILPAARGAPGAQELLKEKVPIKNIITILETCAGLRAPDEGSGHFDGIRQTIPHESHKHTVHERWDHQRAGPGSSCGRDDLELDQHTEHGSYLALDPEKSQRILMALNREVANLSKKGTTAVLLASPVSRAYVKRLTERYMPDLVVLSHNEIPRGHHQEPGIW